MKDDVGKCVWVRSRGSTSERPTAASAIAETARIPSEAVPPSPIPNLEDSEYLSKRGSGRGPGPGERADWPVWQPVAVMFRLVSVGLACTALLVAGCGGGQPR